MSLGRRYILIWILSILIVGAGAFLAYSYYKNKPSPVAVNPTPTPTTQITPTPSVIPAPLDGVLSDPALANRHPLAIMVENHPEARPQQGLNEASLVYETLAEGGVTRFMAVYGPRIPKTVGPVRSARTYYVGWAEEYDAFYAHYGGSSDALRKIPYDKVRNINGMGVGQPYFWRHWYSGVSGSEHTAFTSPAKLYQYADKKGWPKTSSFTVWNFKDDAPTTERPQGGSLTVNFSYGSTFNVKYAYDPATNTYKRSLAGSAHKDRITSVQIAPKNVIVQMTKKIYKAGKKDHDVQIIGTGKAWVYLDGKQIAGTWTKLDKKARTIFTDTTGNQITFNRGQTWIEVIHSDISSKWTPAS